MERVLSDAYSRRLVSEPAIDAALARGPHRPGAGALRALLQRLAGPVITRSEAERRLHRLIAAAGLPRPAANVVVAGYEVDVVWPTHRLVVELDGFAFHGHRVAFERDRRRDARLVAAGYRVMRVTWRQLTDEQLAVAAALGGALAVGLSDHA
jgi:very-short-patch-repair endonuclease